MKVWKRIPPLSGRKWRAIRNLIGVLVLLAALYLYFGQVTFSPEAAAQAQMRYELLEEGEFVEAYQPTHDSAKYVVLRAADGTERIVRVEYWDASTFRLLHYKFGNIIRVLDAPGERPQSIF